MRVLQQIVRSRYFLMVILGLPFVFTVVAYNTGRLYYGEVLHSTGEISARLMMVAMAATPLLLILPGRAFPRWLVKNRRYVGVASFMYAALHTAIYVERTALPSDILAEAALPEYWTGWVALIILMVLALTSNDAAVLWLKRSWKKLHRLVYLAAVLIFAHWVLVAFNRAPAIAHLGLLGALECFRIWKSKRVSPIVSEAKPS